MMKTRKMARVLVENVFPVVSPFSPFPPLFRHNSLSPPPTPQQTRRPHHTNEPLPFFIASRLNHLISIRPSPSLHPSSIKNISTMKSFQSIAILATLSGLQLLSGSQAQAATSSAGVATTVMSPSAAGTATTTGGIVTPSPPSFINTPGLVVNSPYDGMQISQNAFLSISASLQTGQALGSIVISVAQADGSNNNTIVNLVNSNALALTETWNVSSAIYPVGNYLMNMIVTPNNTAPAAPGATSTVAPTTPTTGPDGGPSVFYWQAHIKVKTPPSPVPLPNGAESFWSGSSLKNTMLATVAASALVLGSALLL